MYVNNDACMSAAVTNEPAKKRPIKEYMCNLTEMLSKARAISGDIRVSLDDDCGPDPNANGPSSDGSCMVDYLNDLETMARDILNNLFLINEIIQG